MTTSPRHRDAQCINFFEILPTGTPVLVGWKNSSGNLIWDVNMDFTQKSRWFRDGHRTPDPKKSNYAGMVSRDIVRIALTYAALNDVDVTAAESKMPTFRRSLLRSTMLYVGKILA